MSITRKKHWMFLAAGAMALAGCSPTPPPASSGDSNPSPVSAEPAQASSLDALAGLAIVNYGPQSTKAGEAFNTVADGSSALWVKADRSLDGYDAALWLNGKRLDNRAINGSTVTGTVPQEDLGTPGTYALEIRIGQDGTELASEKVDFVIE